MRNSLGLPWVTLSVYLDIYPSGGVPLHGLRPRFQGTSSIRESGAGFGFNFGFDESAEAIAEKTRIICAEMPLCIEYLERTFSQDGYLAADEFPASFLRLETLVWFQRRDDVAASVEQLEWEDQPELGAANRYGNLEWAEGVLLAYRLLGTRPSRRWIEMISATLASIKGKPSKPNAERHRRVLELVEDAGV